MNGESVDQDRDDWTVTVSIYEHEGHPRAQARWRWRGREAVGVGVAKLNAADRNVAEIGDELAVARALSDLTRRLMAITTRDIETVTQQPTTSLQTGL